MKQRISQIIEFFRDRDYFRQLFHLAFPIALQNLITSSLNMVAVLFIGQLGEVAVASVGLGNQLFFLFNLVIFGVVSGAAMFVAQLWGKRDVPNIRRVLGLTVKLALIAALFFWVLANFFPEKVLNLYTNDADVIAMGSRYLRIACWTYVFFGITAAFSVASRSTGNVKLPLFVSTSALALDVAIAFPLIFGFKAIGLPAMGVEGAALAALIARVLECFAMILFIYKDKFSTVAASLHDLFEIDLKFTKVLLKPILPVIANETLWSLGITTYNSIYGHVGTDAIAAMNIVQTIDQMAFVIFLGLGTATAIMVGNQIGQGNTRKAYLYGGRSLVLQSTGAMVMGVLVYLFAANIFQLYKVSPEVISNARLILNVMAMGMWIRATNHVIIIGILRSGGDTKFSLILDGMVIWLIGVPITAAGASFFTCRSTGSMRLRFLRRSSRRVWVCGDTSQKNGSMI